MSKRSPILVEIGIGLVLTGFFAFSYQKGGTAVETVSQKAYDFFARQAGPAPTTDSVRIIGIDQSAVENLGRWPWPRSLTAQLLDDIAAGGAKVVGLNVFLVDPDKNEATEEISQLEERYKQILDSQLPLLERKRIDPAPFQSFLDHDLADAKNGLNADSTLAQSIEQAVNIVLPMYFVPGEALGKVEDVPDFFAKEKIDMAADAVMPPAQAASLPLDVFSKVAMAIGHANLYPDSDGTLRRIPLLIRYGNAAYPSFALQIVREFLSLQRGSLKWVPPAGFQLQKAKIPVDDTGMAFIRYAGGAGTIKSFSALSVLDGSLPEKSLDNKIVLVGLTAPGAADGTTMVAPGGERITGLEILANHIENILTQTFISRPPWAQKMEWGLLAAAAFVVVLVLPLMRARISIPVAALFFAGIVGSSFFLFTKHGMWVSPAHGASLLLVGFVVLVGKRLVFTEKGKEMVEAEGVETNKMLGLSFQGQGMLDLAFEKFRRVPLDAPMKDLLYNLALDMERKRMFAKAASVYGHIGTVDPKFKDIQDKIELLKKAGEGAVFGGIGKKGADSTVVVEGLGQTTTLGRYEVMRELGRGAMGIVYLGRDPKINRQVAIKTLRFTEETDEDQTQSVKERFFREAESAGNLTHPNIIRIFDAGEDQEVAYIAMELLEGVDLKKYCDKGHLFKIDKALDVVTQVANGLDYAHKQGVVHRDIKPGNIMMLRDGTLRITDFGIARIQASSKTATGAVLGTPAYMSPEQVVGKKVDGRADIFSLGVTMFELLTGQKPFQADSIATLLYQIANSQHPNPRDINPDLPKAIVPIIDKALAKNADDRYQTASEMAMEIQTLLLKMLSGSQTDTSPAMAVDVPAAPAPAAPVAKPQSPLDDLNAAAGIPPVPSAAAINFEGTLTSGTGALPVSPGKSPAFFSELEQTFNVTASEQPLAALTPILSDTPAAAHPEDKKSAFQIIQNDSENQNIPEEDFLKALGADSPGLPPAMERTIAMDPIIPPPVPGTDEEQPRREAGA